jgi:ADP-ribosylglycohydrolase
MYVYKGLIYGAAIGDAVGLSTCCMSSDECLFHYNKEGINYSDIVQDELRVRWKQGDWTSNFDTMVMLLKHL